MEGRVLYLYLEGSLRGLRKRLADLADGGPLPDNLHFHQTWPTGTEAVTQIEQFLEEYPDTVLVVVDTLKAIRRNSGYRNAYDVDYEDVAPISSLANARSIAILLVHHTNKGTWDDPMDAISGSMGLRGAVDTQAVLLRGSAGMTLTIEGRDMERQELAFRFDQRLGTVVYAGSLAEVRLSDARRHVFDALTTEGARSEDTAIPFSALYESMQTEGYEGSRQAANKVVLRLRDEPGSRVRGEGRKGYWLAEDVRLPS
jgi:hypothetical protein